MIDHGAAAIASWGYVILAALVVAEQVPLPVPAVPVLLAIGALAADGRMSIATALAIACAAAVPMDLLWRRIGAARGTAALQMVCRLSLEPDSCVRRTDTLFQRHGSRVLLVAKFLPGLTALAPALAGLAKVPLIRFLSYDIAGVVLWAGTWMLLGYAFGTALDAIVAELSRAGMLLAALAAGFALYLVVKLLRRRRFLRQLRTARVTAEALKAMLDRGEDVWIADLRSALEVQAAPYTIPGARLVALEDIARGAARIPRDREIVLVCT